MTAVLPLAAALGWYFFRAPLGTYALEWKAGAARWLLGGWCAALLLKALCLTGGAAAGVYQITWQEHLPRNALLSIGGILLATFVPSIAEDLLTRGLWYRHGRLGTGIRFVMVSSTIYLLNHIFRLGLGPIEWVMIFSFGLAYALAVMQSGTLWAAVGLHWGWNAAGGIADVMVDVDVHGPQAAKLISALGHLAVVASLLAAARYRRRAAASVCPE
jgi:membrane protease YdiL (CAAX protease family)